VHFSWPDQDFDAFCAYAENAWRKARQALGTSSEKGRTGPEGQG